MMQFTVGLKADGKADHTVVDADDALIAALKVKMQRPEAPARPPREQEGRRAASGPRTQEGAVRPLPPPPQEWRGRRCKEDE